MMHLFGLLAIHLEPDRSILGVVCFLLIPYISFSLLFWLPHLCSPGRPSWDWTQSLYLRRAQEALSIMFIQNMEPTLLKSVSVGATPSFYLHVQHMFRCTVYFMIHKEVSVHSYRGRMHQCAKSHTLCERGSIIYLRSFRTWFRAGFETIKSGLALLLSIKGNILHLHPHWAFVSWH